MVCALQIDGEAARQARRRVEDRDWRPRNCVWELTLACPLRCMHCGSRAGKVRNQELSTEACVEVAGQLADLGCELVTLSGGEPTLHRGWDTIARALTARGVVVNLVTSGIFRNTTAGDVAGRAQDAGMSNIGVSIDGPPEVHDRIRGAGTFAETVAAVEVMAQAGMKVAVLTTVSRMNLSRLSEVRQLVIDAGASQWRLQLAKPMGAFAEHRQLVIKPRDLLELMPLLARFKKAGGIGIGIGDSIGYYGPYDPILRGRGWRGRREQWQGCQAGLQVIGIEADGGVKGCLSLQACAGPADPFVEGNLRESSMTSIWHQPGAFAFNRDFQVEDLSGPCQGCDHGALCRGGARCVASALGGPLTEDPYCYYRVAAQRRVATATARGPAAAAAVLALSLGQVGCGSRSALGSETAVVVDSGGSRRAVDAAAPGDAHAEPDTGVVICPDYGFVPIDAGPAPIPDTGPIATPDYGVDPVPVPIPAVDAGSDAAPDASVADDYGVSPDCTEVCCECDYGLTPEGCCP